MSSVVNPDSRPFPRGTLSLSSDLHETRCGGEAASQRHQKTAAEAVRFNVLSIFRSTCFKHSSPSEADRAKAEPVAKTKTYPKHKAIAEPILHSIASFVGGILREHLRPFPLGVLGGIPLGFFGPQGD